MASTPLVPPTTRPTTPTPSPTNPHVRLAEEPPPCGGASGAGVRAGPEHVERLLPSLPGGRDLSLPIETVGQVDERPGRGIEPLAFCESRARGCEVAALHGGPPRHEKLLGCGRVRRLRTCAFTVNDD